MLRYINKVLTIHKIIATANSIITLQTDTDCNYIGVLTLSNDCKKSFEFIKEGPLYKARLVILEEDLPYINKCSLHLVSITEDFSMESNKVSIEFDSLKVKRDIKISASNDIKDLKISVSKLSKKLDTVLTKAPSFIVSPMTPINTAYIKPGMIPVSIDETGRCIFQYPFIDHVTEINGQKTVNNAILITAKDIPIEQTDVATAIKAHTDAIKELNNLMKTISSELKITKNKVADIEKALLQHTDSSII